MLKLAIAYVSTGVVFLILDGAFLTLAGMKLYKPELGSLISEQVRLGPAALFYLLYVAGLMYFCVGPNLGGDWTKAAIAGAVLGLVAYGTYDLTCHAVMRVWSTKVTVIDMLWGAFVSAAACGGGVILTRLISTRTGA